MLVVENNSVYEIDEECLKRRSVPEECEVYKKIVREREVGVQTEGLRLRKSNIRACDPGHK